ncbi:hypothetical protein EV361DRAFT_618026 [Lentinula raphanica]|nr:hypothetical protein EV361DRAFT_618026 [Lentinula raphanica]
MIIFSSIEQTLMQSSLFSLIISVSFDLFSVLFLRLYEVSVCFPPFIPLGTALLLGTLLSLGIHSFFFSPGTLFRSERLFVVLTFVKHIGRGSLCFQTLNLFSNLLSPCVPYNFSLSFYFLFLIHVPRYIDFFVGLSLLSHTTCIDVLILVASSSSRLAAKFVFAV